jgi:hypothetical protein
MATFTGSCNMFGTGSISGIAFNSQVINSATYGAITSNQININISGVFVTYTVVRTNITGGNIETTFSNQTGSTFYDSGLNPNTQYSYQIIPYTGTNPGPTYPVNPVWTLVNVGYNPFSYSLNNIQINWTGTYSTITVTRTSPTASSPSGTAVNYPNSSSPQNSVNGYITDTGLTFGTYIYTIVATNGGGVSTTITANYVAAIPLLPAPTFGTPTNVTALSYGNFGYWIVTGSTTVTFSQGTRIGYVVVGPGGGGGTFKISGTNYDTGGGGGGGGGICWSTKSASSIVVDDTSTYQITIGRGATGVTSFLKTGTTPVTYLSATAGGAGANVNGGYQGGAGGAGGTATGGTNNITGAAGGTGTWDASYNTSPGFQLATAGGNGALISLPDINKTYKFGAGGGGGGGGAGGLMGGGNGNDSSPNATYYGGGGGGTTHGYIPGVGQQGYFLIYY